MSAAAANGSVCVSGVTAHVGWSRQAKFVIALCFLLNMIDGMDILVMSYIAPSLQRDWSVTPGAFAIVFSAGLGGMAIGGLAIAPLADRFGRRRLILFALPLMATAMIASSYADTVAHLVLARIVVGIGIGTVLACIAALAAEFAPADRRNFAVGILQGGYPVGATVTGLLTAWALPHLQWHGVLLGTGLVTLAVLPLAWWQLPETPRLAAAAGKVTLSDAIGGARLTPSLLLWSATICGFMALYFVASWITKLAIEAGLPETQAIVASAIYNIGAFFGVLGMSLAASRFDIRMIACTLLIAAAGAFLWFGGVKMSVAWVLIAAFVLGMTLQGGFNALYPLAARVYPARVRATGIGWAMGLGRIGAFTGPLIGGWALGAKLPLVAVFGFFCLPLVIAATCARAVTFGEIEE